MQPRRRFLAQVSARGFFGMLGLLLAAGAGACRLVTGDCTSLLSGGVTVRVVDAATSAGIASGANILVVDGRYRDSLVVPTTPEHNDREFPLAMGRPGTYEVAVWKEGYEVWRQSGVAVTRRDRCEVAFVRVRAALTRLSR